MDSRQAKKLVRRFFEILDAKEYNQSGMGDILWSPTYVRIDEQLKVTISSCRCMRVVELDQILKDLKEWSNEKVQGKRKERSISTSKTDRAENP